MHVVVTAHIEVPMETSLMAMEDRIDEILEEAGYERRPGTFPQAVVIGAHHMDAAATLISPTPFDGV